MKRVFSATGTVKAYFVSEETDIERLEEIAREVIDETIEFYGTEECMRVDYASHPSLEEIPKDERGECVFIRSEKYEQDIDLTVEEAFEDA